MKDVGKYVDGCDLCQWMKNRTEAPVGKLIANKILKRLWTYLTVDFITKLLLVARKDVILVICNRLSKMTHFITIMEETSAEGLVRLFRDNMWKLHKLLESIILDRGPQFAVELTKELNECWELRWILSPTNKWIDQTNELRVKKISPVLCRS